MGHSMTSTNVHGGSHPSTGYTTPNDVSGVVTPDDLDLPIDFGAFDDFPITDSLHGFTSHPPSAPTPHTHHYTPQLQQQQQQPVHPSHGHGNILAATCTTKKRTKMLVATSTTTDGVL